MTKKLLFNNLYAFKILNLPIFAEICDSNKT